MALQQLRKALPLGSATRCMSTFVAGESALTLPELPYEYSALEPCISGQIMELHHKKHHNAYLTNYNKALEQWQEAESKQDSNALPKISSALHFNGGGSLLSPHSLLAVDFPGGPRWTRPLFAAYVALSNTCACARPRRDASSPPAIAHLRRTMLHFRT